MPKVKHPSGRIVEYGERPEYGDRVRIISVNGVSIGQFSDNPIVFVKRSEIDGLPKVP